MRTLVINHSTNHTVEQALANDYSGIPIEEQVKSEANSFVRCSKEGRKFGLGMVVITQRLSAISEEIRTQAEDLFTLYEGNTG